MLISGRKPDGIRSLHSSNCRIDQSLYEAAELDGAGRFRKMWHVTLPGIKSTIIVLLIMNLGWVMNASFEVPYILGSGLLQDVSQTIDILY